MNSKLHLQSRHRRAIVEILDKALPEVEVWAYGSRITGRSHDGSDLDLVLRRPELDKIPSGCLQLLKEMFRNSNIPFFVEVRDWANVPTRFHDEIQKQHVVLKSRPSD